VFCSSVLLLLLLLLLEARAKSRGLDGIRFLGAAPFVAVNEWQL